ncbi:MAG: hypothetical protein JWO06_1422 [Bacteroidota bacterium]|nr:hypothetical protein [Bacteroidota bacterium]
MSQPKPIIKIVVLLFFIALLGGFTAYRSGVFSTFGNGKPISNINFRTDMVVDSPGLYNDERMSSSKSGPIFRPAPKIKPSVDTPVQQKQRSNMPQQQQNNVPGHKQNNNGPNQQ